jgi:hypothetical protein
MKSKLQAVLSHLQEPENVISLLGIIIAGILGYSGIKSNDTQQALAAILTVLGTFAIAQIIAGYESSKAQKRLERIEYLIQRPSSFSSRSEIDAQEPFQRFLTHGQSVLIIGISLVGTVGPLRGLFKDLVQKGVKFRFLLLNPSSPCLEFVAEAHGMSQNSLRNDIVASLAHLAELVETIHGSKNGAMQYRLMNNTPGASAVMRDGNSDQGVIRSELHLYHTDTTGRLTYSLTPDDGEVYSFYRDALEQMWNNAVRPDIDVTAQALVDPPASYF